MSSTLKPLTQSRPDSGYYDGESPMEVDGDNHRSRISRHNRNGLFSNLNGSVSSVRLRREIPGDSNGGGTVLTAEIGVRSTPRHGGRMGAGVTRVITSGEGRVDTVSTTVVRPASGDSDGTSVRLNYSRRPAACENYTDDVLLDIIIEDVKDEEESHRDQNGTTGQKEDVCAGTPKPHPLPDIVPQKPVIPDPPFQIFVRNVDGKIYTLTVRMSDTVDILLKEVHKRINVHPDQFWLNYAGRKLHRGETMNDCGVVKECTIFVQMRLRGG